jgi:hypothetical protein
MPIPETHVWETMENNQRTVAIEVLARLIAKTTFPNQNKEKDRDR